MTEETPVAGEPLALPEVKAKPGRVARAKPQVEIEADRKAEEARVARTVGRAAPLMEADRNPERGDRTRMVTCLVLNKGEGRIHTGEIDTLTKRPSFFAAGESFQAAEPEAIKLEARGYAQRAR
jgi:hypothetical protein